MPETPKNRTVLEHKFFGGASVSEHVVQVYRRRGRMRRAGMGPRDGTPNGAAAQMKSGPRFCVGTTSVSRRCAARAASGCLFSRSPVQKEACAGGAPQRPRPVAQNNTAASSARPVSPISTVEIILSAGMLRVATPLP